MILLSGGIDSALCLARYGARQAIGFDYGQPHVIELNYAEKIAEHFGVPFIRSKIPFIPRIDDVIFAGRNAVMLTIAASFAQAHKIDTIIIGCNLNDALRFPDCRPSFIKAMDSALEESYGVRVLAPLLETTKQQIVIDARKYGIPETWTCYTPTDTGQQCGQCYSCKGLTC